MTSVRILAPSIEGKHIRPSGEDVRAGETLVQAGRRLQAPELGLLATAGFAHPLVHPRPRVVVLSTGDELIPPSQDPEYGQVRDSNAYTLFGGAPRGGRDADDRRDRPRTTSRRFKEVVLSHLTQADAFISSGGVSVGERDVVKAAFFRRGEVDFYRVAMQPGHAAGVRPGRGQAVLRPAGQPRERVRELRGVHPAGADEDDGPPRSSSGPR